MHTFFIKLEKKTALPFALHPNSASVCVFHKFIYRIGMPGPVEARVCLILWDRFSYLDFWVIIQLDWLRASEFQESVSSLALSLEACTTMPSFFLWTLRISLKSSMLQQQRLYVSLTSTLRALKANIIVVLSFVSNIVWKSWCGIDICCHNSLVISVFVYWIILSALSLYPKYDMVSFRSPCSL